MKKFVSMVMAGAMAASLASVAFATPVPADDVDFFNVSETAYTYDEDNKSMDAVTGNVKFGDEIYYELSAGTFANVNSGAVGEITSSDVIKNIKVKSTFDEGNEYVDSVKLVKKIVSGQGKYYVEVSLKENAKETEDKDIVGTVTLTSTKYKADNEKEKELNVTITVENEAANLDEAYDDDHVYSFKGQEDEEQEIKLFGEMGRFVVDTRGQGDLVIKSNVEYNEGIENIASDVNYVYFNGNGATFNKIGTLYLEANESDFVYKVNADKTLSKVDAKFDPDEGENGAFVIRTRTLGSYVIAEKELDLTSVNAGLAPEAVAPVEPSVSNPVTGAAL